MALSSAPGARPLARTPLHASPAAWGARFIDEGGWQIAESYSVVDRELEAARTSLGVVDLSPFPKTSLLGSGLSALVQPVLGIRAPAKPGGVAALAEAGPVLACCLTARHLLLLALTPGAKALGERLTALGQEPSVVVRDVTSGYAGFGVFGPRTPDLLRHLTAFSAGPAVLPESSCAETSMAGVHALLVRPPGLALPAVYLYVAWDLAEYVWERLWQAGRAYRLTPVGLAAYQSLLQDRPTGAAAN